MDPRRSSAGPWPLLAVVLASVSVGAMAFTAWGARAAGPSYDVAWTAGAAAALAGMISARRGAGPDHRARWSWWTAAAGAWLAGEMAWDLFAVIGHPSSPNVADLGWWAFALLVIVGLLRPSGRSRGIRLVVLVEVLPLIVAAMALTFAQLWTDAVGSDLGLAPRISALVYPGLYVSAAVVTLQAMVGGALRPVRGPGPRLVLFGIVSQALAFIMWSEQLLDQTYVQGGTVVDPLWVTGLLAIAAGGLIAGRMGEPARPAESEPGSRGGVLPGAMFVGLVATLVFALLTHEPLGALLTLATGLLTCGTTLIVRGGLLARRLRHLLTRERDARTALAHRETELARLNEQLLEDSRRDPLTGLRNRRALAEDMDELEALAERGGEPFAIALCDVDRFKPYNDQLGHLAGDRALRSLAGAVAGQLAPGEAAYRYGGEELLLVLAAHDAPATAERVRAAVAALKLAHPGDPSGAVTVSIGLATGVADSATLLARADAALYEAKHAGRDRVVIAASGAAQPAPGRTLHDTVDDPVLRHLRTMLAVSRAGGGARGPLPVLEAVAEAIRSELRFGTVVVNLRDPIVDELRVVLVLGDPDARRALLGTASPLAAFSALLDPRFDRCGAAWIPAGAHDFDRGPATWTPASRLAAAPGAWLPDDMLLLPLRGTNGDVLAVLSVDEPHSGARPTDGELRVLMAVADHAALALEQSLREDAPAVGGETPELRLAAVMLLAETLDLRDAGTAAHSRTVGTYARATAAALGLDARRVERLHAAGVLHDLGKLGIADAILHKPSGLDQHEWREMRRHPEIGARILEHAGLHDIAGWVRAHHERLDGRGYPAALTASEIPLEARILAVADAYEAMVADRPYRAGMPAAEAAEELRRCAGTQFDAEVVAAFLHTLAPAPARLAPVAH